MDKEFLLANIKRGVALKEVARECSLSVLNCTAECAAGVTERERPRYRCHNGKSHAHEARCVIEEFPPDPSQRPDLISCRAFSLPAAIEYRASLPDRGGSSI